MATCYSRTWASGKVSWYTKVPDGKGKWKPLLLRGVKSEPAAKKLANEIEKERERAGHGLPAASPFTGTFAELCAWAWQTHFRKLGSAQPDQSRFHRHVGDPDKGTATWLGALPARKVTGVALTRYFSELTAEGVLSARGKPYSPGAVNRLRAQLSTVFKVAGKHGYWLGENPVHATDAEAEIAAGHDILQAHEIKPVLDATPDYWRGCLAVGILAGLRKGEIFALEKRDVDLARNEFRVRRSHDRQTTKGHKHSAVPIHPDLLPYLEPWMKTPGPLLFPNHDGERRSPQVDLCRVIQVAMVRAGLIDHFEYKCRRSVDGVRCGFVDQQPTDERRDCPRCGFRLWVTARARRIGWHEATRHTSASHMLMSGAGVASVQAILRHADPRLTIKTYGHLSAGFLATDLGRMALPGLGGTVGDTVQTAGKMAENLEPVAIPVHTPDHLRGAPMVRSGGTAHQGAAAGIMNRHESGSKTLWSRGVSNPGPMHCERIGEVSPVAPAFAPLCQTSEISHGGSDPSSTLLPSVPPCPGGRGAPMVRRTRSAHHAPRSASIGGSAPGTEDLLTIQQVADRLQVGRTWVRRRIAAGDLTAERAHPQAPALIPAAALADYLRRFPGIVPTEPPAPPAAAPARARKGAA